MMLTEAALAQQCESVLQRSGTPARLREVIVQELEHLRLFLMPGCLSPESKNEPRLAESKVEKTARCGITHVSSHVLVPCNHFHVCFLG